MGKELLIIPLIALAVWVLQYLFRSGGDTKPNNRTRALGKTNKSNRPTKKTTDMDRYLDNVRLEKQRDDAHQSSMGNTGMPARQQKQRSSINVPRGGRSPQTVDPLVVLELAPEERRASLEQRLEAREARATHSVETPLASAAPMTHVPLDGTPRAAKMAPVMPRGATLLELGRMFKTPASLRAAFVLNEVLGPPLSQRKNAPEQHP